LRKTSDPEEQEFDDNIRPEDGLERHWLFFNGETYRLYAFIGCLLFWYASAFCICLVKATARSESLQEFLRE
jgi:hypothetical protein